MPANFLVAENNAVETRALSPGEHLRIEIERLGLDQIEVSHATGVSRQSINNIINDRQPISRTMAAKLGQLTGRSSDYWLRSEFFPQDAAAFLSKIEPAGGSSGISLLVNHQIIRAVTEGVVGIEPFDETNVQLASLDLTLNDFLYTAEGEQIDITGDRGFALKPGGTAIVATKEWVSFPRNYLGQVGGMSKLARLGVMISCGFQIDPGFEGNLLFCIYNAGANSFLLHGGDAIISLEIIGLNTVPDEDARATRQLREAANRDRVVPLLRAGADGCKRLIHDAIRARANVEPVGKGFEAKIAELDVEFSDLSPDAALNAAVRGALMALKTLRERPDMARKERTKYARFFEEIATNLELNSDQVRTAITRLGITAEGHDVLVVSMRDGEDILLHLPTETSKITLRHLAQRLRQDVANVVLALAELNTGSNVLKTATQK